MVYTPSSAVWLRSLLDTALGTLNRVGLVTVTVILQRKERVCYMFRLLGFRHILDATALALSVLSGVVCVS